MSMRITITNDEPGFSDARLAIKIPGMQRMELKGGVSTQMVLLPGVDHQIAIQCLFRDADDKDQDQHGHD